MCWCNVAKHEYKTTSARFALERTYRDPYSGNSDGYSTDPEEIPDPVLPEGDGWAMVGSTADRSTLFWFWKRTVK